MRFLGVGDWNDLGSIYLDLLEAGHEVRVYASEPEAADILAGMVPRVEDWRACLEWIRAAGSEGIVLFETATRGAIQDDLRRAGFSVVGGSALGDRLERERGFGQEILRRCGLPTIPSWSFRDAGETAAFVRNRPGRYVLKYDGGEGLLSKSFPGRADDGADVLALLDARGPAGEARHLLMSHVDGVEMGVGAYFNGERFLSPACLDWEHKRFFPGDVGELTDEMGTLVTYEGPSRLFDCTLGSLGEVLRDGGYRGYINLNTIVNERGIWPLEFTSRFGYPGSAILGALQPDGWADLFRRVADPSSTSFRTDSGYAVGVVLTVPPFPYPDGYDRLGKGTRIAFGRGLQEKDRRHLHFGEVALCSGELRCAGAIGAILTVTGCGDDADAARTEAYRRVEQVILPNVRYRNDIGERFVRYDRARLREWGYL
jgi:phosphoribosylamine--glycine ligase